MMDMFMVGQRYTDLVSTADEIKVSIDQSGMILYVKWHGVTNADINSFRQDSPFEIRFVTLDGIIYFLFRFGSLPWMDSPFSPAIEDEILIAVPEEGQGLALTIVLAEGKTGEVKNIRIIGLGNRFSTVLAKEILLLTGRRDYTDYMDSVKRTYSKYTTKDLLHMADERYRL